ncbi:hypothetical protein JNUCC31_14350 [Paenibacillus sp. JNUCC31]|uniref:hypothetical protein n=1 Tax=Paenibacillus sp. JNUCC-31 TaxID=2777983 RepID=UPI0017851D0D|nr:hypothetical protein [Paenibacillus sp. JNUCC-31]QOS81918.1 hypothetical protein JNUCC31_14350 [Paenibacillus sp. JNUCC-31]
MIDLTSDMQFTTLIQTNALPTDCLTFIHDYMHQLRNAHEDEAFPGFFKCLLKGDNTITWS